MNKAVIFLSAVFTFLGLQVKAQYVEDALRFSQTSIGGSTRMWSIGGAQTSLGGDISAASGNPAGLGFYNQSEFTISPSLQFFNAKATYFGANAENDDAGFGIGNVGIVFNNSKDDIVPGKWRGGSFAISLNRINNFNSDITYEGRNGTDDFVDYAIEKGNNELDNGIGINNASSITQAFFNAYLIDLVPWFDDNGVPVTDNATGDTLDIYKTQLNPVSPNDPAIQRERITRNGGQTQWNFAYGGNFDDKVYLGASIGFVTLDYEEKRVYTETRPAADDAIIDDYTYNETRQLTGAGINANLGIIYRPINELTFGLSYSSPTIYSLNERFSNNIVANWNNYLHPYSQDGRPLNQEVTDVLINDYDFRLKTPQRVNGGATYFFGKNGFITGDVEWVDFATNNLRSDNNEFSSDNDVIRGAYASAINVRVGGEFRYDKFRLRAGYAQMGNPYENNEFDGSVTSITGGVGFRLNNFFMDLSLVHQTSKDSISPYVFSDGFGPVANIDKKNNYINLTLGFAF